jgi:hypothetical protein
MSDSDLFRFPRCVNRYNFDPTSLTALLPNRLVSKEAKISSHTIGREYTYMAAPAFLDQSKCHFHLIGSRCLWRFRTRNLSYSVAYPPTWQSPQIDRLGLSLQLNASTLPLQA